MAYDLIHSRSIRPRSIRRERALLFCALPLLMLLVLATPSCADGGFEAAEDADLGAVSQGEAGEASEDAAANEDRSSSNFNKTDRLLPGEEVITPTGKRVKVWSTKGPVPVDRAPEPFEDREKSVLQGSHIVIDAERAADRDRRDHRTDEQYRGPREQYRGERQ